MGSFLNPREFGHTGFIYVYKLDGTEKLIWMKTKDKSYLRIIDNENNNFFINGDKISKFVNQFGFHDAKVSDVLSDDVLMDLENYLLKCVKYNRYCKFRKKILDLVKKRNIDIDDIRLFLSNQKLNYRFLSKIDDYKVRDKVLNDIYNFAMYDMGVDIILHCYKKKSNNRTFYSVFNISSSKYRVVVNDRIIEEISNLLSRYGKQFIIEKEKLGKNWHIYFFLYSEEIGNIPVEFGIRVKNSFQSSSSLYMNVVFKLISSGSIIVDKHKRFRRKHIGFISSEFDEFIEEVDNEISNLIDVLEEVKTVRYFANKVFEIEENKHIHGLGYYQLKQIFGDNLDKKITFVEFIDKVLDYYKMYDEKTYKRLLDEFEELIKKEVKNKGGKNENNHKIGKFEEII